MNVGFLKTEPNQPQNSKKENSVSAVQFSKTDFGGLGRVSAVQFSKTDFGGLGTVFHVVSFSIHLAA